MKRTIAILAIAAVTLALALTGPAPVEAAGARCGLVDLAPHIRGGHDHAAGGVTAYGISCRDARAAIRYWSHVELLGQPGRIIQWRCELAHRHSGSTRSERWRCARTSRGRVQVVYYTTGP